MSKKIGDILKDPEKRIGDAENVPAALLRTVLRDLAVDAYQWNKLVDDYYSSPYSTVPKNKVAVATDKNNFNSGIAKGNVTWGRLARALFILCPIKITFSIKLHWRGGFSTTHNYTSINPMKRLVDQNGTPPRNAIKDE